VVVFYSVDERFGMFKGYVRQYAMAQVDNVAVFAEPVDHLAHVCLDT
jgi:hypothetical protein